MEETDAENAAVSTKLVESPDASEKTNVKLDDISGRNASPGRCSRFFRSTSTAIYASHFLSCWGDRMWSFAVGIYLNDLSCESLRLVAIYGLALCAAVVLFGALIGDIVDKYKRLSVARTVLFFQNALVALCAVLVCMVYYFQTYIYSESWRSSLCEAGIIVLAIFANLFSVAHKVSVEKEWISVVCEGDSKKLSVLSSTMRAIDQFTLIASPILTGFIMEFGSMLVSAAFIASWNLLTVLIEYSLLLRVYNKVPALAVKNVVENTSEDDATEMTEMLGKVPEEASQNDDHKGRDSVKLSEEDDDREESAHALKATADESPENKKKHSSVLQKMFSTFIALGSGWKVYMSYDVKYAGFGLAFLYMTVLGFDNITTGYAYNQGASQGVLGGIMAASAVVGLVATFVYPKMTRRIGVVRTGLIGFVLEILALSLSVLSVWLPGSPFDITNWETPEPFSGPRSSEGGCSLVNTASNMTSRENGVPVGEDHSFMSLGFLMAGICAARFGLWTADLATSQLLLETVVLGQRGAVNGVQSSLNTLMDMLKALMVIAIPAPSHFGLLVIVSFTSICLGGVSYSIYSRKVRGHLFHFDKLKCVKPAATASEDNNNDNNGEQPD